MSATLYGVYTSHPAHAAHLMLEYKRIDHRVVNLLPGTHAAAVRLLGFRGGTVPAMRLNGRRVQGTRAIARALDQVRPNPPLFPADSEQRRRVEQAEEWADDVLQRVPRRIGNWVFANRSEMRARIAREAGLPAARLVAAAGRPLTWYFARKAGGDDPARVRRDIEELPDLLEHVDRLIAAGTIGGPERNAADFQIGTSVRLLMTIEDLAPAFEGRAAAHLALELMPSYPTGIPAGLVPAEWLPWRAAGAPAT